VIANDEDRFPKFSDDEVWKRGLTNRDCNRVVTLSTIHILFYITMLYSKRKFKYVAWRVRL